MKGLFIKQPGLLIAADDATRAMLNRIKNGTEVTAEPKVPRNVRFHRMFWALMTKVWENQERYATVENLVDAFKVVAGHADLIVLPSGKEVWVPRSISFAKMDDTAFSDFYDRCADVLAKHFLPGITSEELKREVGLMIGARAA